MGAKVTFDSENRLVVVTAAPVAGVVTLDVQVDLYSDMKEDIRASATLAANPPAFLGSEGGVPTATGFTGMTYFLNNERGWRIQPYDADHECYLVGNIFPIDPDADWWVARPGRTIIMSREFSNLAQAIAVGSGVTQQDKVDIANEVWTRNAPSGTAAEEELVLIRQVLVNKLELDDGEGNNMTLYDDAGNAWIVKWPSRDKNTDGILSPIGIPARRGQPVTP